MLKNEEWQQAFHIFETASDLSPEEQLSFLHALHASPDIIEEVLELLKGTPPPSHSSPEISLVGKQFGRYIILAEIGRGGMGQVYKACDTRLERFVAIKILPSDMVWSPARRALFEREARVTSALNHPNIVTIHDIELDASQPYLVLEFVEGRTLHQIVQPKGLPWATALDYGLQLAQALQAAASVTHRDLKPSNLMITAEGRLKVLDFGIAKLRDAGLEPIAASDLVGGGNGKGGATEPGETHGTTVGGTPDYMAPEQMWGGRADGRSDIFSFGAVFFFLLTGEQAFCTSATGERDARWTSWAHSNLNRHAKRIIQSCLQADPAKRPANADALYHALQGARDRPTQRLRWFLAASLSLIAAIAALTRLTDRAPSSPFGKGPTTVYNASLRPIPFSSLEGSETQPSFSPDGGQIAFVWNNLGSDDNLGIYIKPVVGPGSPRRLISGAADQLNPVWSRDGRHIAYLRRSHGQSDLDVVIVPAVGGPERAIGKVSDRRWHRSTLTWSPDGNEVVVADARAPGEWEHLGLWRLSLKSGERTAMTDPPRGLSDFEPSFSPDGHWFAFVRGSYADFSNIWLMPAQGDGDPRPLTSEGKVISSLAWSPNSRDLIFSISLGGLWHISVNGGSPLPLLETFGETDGLAVARKGNRLAFVHNYEDLNIWSFSVSGASHHTPVKLIASSLTDDSPRYSPDGSRIVFSSNRSGTFQIWICGADGSNPRQLTLFEDALVGSPAWSPDGREIAFDARVKGNADVYVVSALGGESRRLTADSSSEIVPAWSHDGMWIYFSSNRMGKSQIWKMPAMGGPAQQVTRHGGFECMESLDGKFLYYTKGTAIEGVWRMAIGGTDEELIPELRAVKRYRYWDVARNGIYFVNPKPSPSINLYKFASSRVSRVTRLLKAPSEGVRGLAVSPDCRDILYTQHDLAIRQILIVNNFEVNRE